MSCTVDIIRVGKRVDCDGYIGTVMYEGPVGSTEGVWLGIDWDDETRGKHDGTHQGVKYFNTGYPKSGSFVREHKVSFGISYCDAVRERYGHDKPINPSFTKEGKVVITIDSAGLYVGSNNVSKPIELVGFTKTSYKQSQYRNLEVIVLKGLKVCGTSSDEDAGSFTPSVLDMDLSKNLLDSWESVGILVEQFPNLRILDLSENRFKRPEVPSKLQQCFKTLEQLVLNNMSYDWQDVLHCAEMWLHIEKLYLAYNRITCLQMPPPSPLDHSVFPLYNLKVLSLDSNSLSSWDELLKLGRLSCLAHLILNNCNINRMYFDDADSSLGQKSELFPKLSNISLMDNLISLWSDIGELDKLQSLNELSIRNNPVLDTETVETVRQLLIAKIGNLRILNHTVIKPEERRGSELDYLKKYGKEWLAVKVKNSDESKREFLKQHPRYTEMMKKYGEVEAGELKTGSTNLKSNLISIRIICPILPDAAPVVKKVPRTMTVQKLKTIAKRLHARSRNVTLSYISREDKRSIEIPLDNELRDLSFYSVESLDTVVVRW